jgi:hypothetical protein
MGVLLSALDPPWSRTKSAQGQDGSSVGRRKNGRANPLRPPATPDRKGPDAKTGATTNNMDDARVALLLCCNTVEITR